MSLETSSAHVVLFSSIKNDSSTLGTDPFSAIANVLDEARLLQVAHQYEQAADVMANRPKGSPIP